MQTQERSPVTKHANYQVVFRACLDVLHSDKESELIADLIWKKWQFSLEKMDQVPDQWLYTEIVGALIEKYSNDIFRFAMKLTRQTDLAQDIVQMVSLKLVDRLHQFNASHGSSISTWLRTIALNEFRSLYRKEAGRWSQLDDFTTGNLESVSVLKFNSHRVSQTILVEEIFEVLPPSERTLLILKYRDGLSEDEIGEMFNLTVLAVKMRLHRTHQKIVEYLATLGVSSNKSRRQKTTHVKSNGSQTMTAREFAKLHRVD